MINEGDTKMAERIVEIFTPEMIAIAIVALTALTLLTFLMILTKMVSFSRIKKRLLKIEEQSVSIEEKHEALQRAKQLMGNTEANLAEALDRIGSIEHRLDGFDHRMTEAAENIESIERHLDRFHRKITENHNQLTGQASKLNEHDTILAEVGQTMGKKAAGFNQAAQRIHTLEEEIQGLKSFQSAFEQIREQILDAFGATEAKRPAQNTQTTERKAFKEKALIPSEEKQSDTEDFYKSRMRYP
jgi:DNA repair ATPase RecN